MGKDDKNKSDFRVAIERRQIIIYDVRANSPEEATEMVVVDGSDGDGSGDGSVSPSSFRTISRAPLYTRPIVNK